MRPFYTISKVAIVPVAAGNALAMVCTATQRGMVTKCVIGPAAVAAASMTDDSMDFMITRITAAVVGGTAVVPSPNDAASAASALTGCLHTSTAGTLVANGIQFGLNRRATYTFVANPGEEILPAVGVTQGVVINEVTVPTVYNINASMVFQE